MRAMRGRQKKLHVAHSFSREGRHGRGMGVFMRKMTRRERGGGGASWSLKAERKG